MPRTTRASAAAGGLNSAEIPIENQVDPPQIEMESIPPPKRRGRPPRAKSVMDKTRDRDSGTSKAQSGKPSRERNAEAEEVADAVAEEAADAVGADAVAAKVADVPGAADAMEGARDQKATETDDGTPRVPSVKKSIQIEISDSEEKESDSSDSTDSDGLPEDPLSATLKIAPLKNVANWKGKGKSKVDEEFDDIDGSSPEPPLPVRSKLSKVSKGKEIDLHQDKEMPDIDQAIDDDSDSEPPEWTEDDQILLDATYPQELALWWKCKEIFDCAPQDLFPAGLRASNGHWDGYHYKDQDRYIKNDTCLTGSFCATLSELICFPHFRKNKEYVQYALSSAVKARCGNKAPSDMQEGYNPCVNWDEKFKEIIEDLQGYEIFFDNRQTRIMEQVLSTYFIGEPPPFSEFLDMPRLKKIAKNSRAVKETYDSNHLMNIDLQNLIKAWDSYNQEGGLNLPSIKAYRDVYDKQHGHAKHGMRAKILGWKKAWILQKRQKDKEEASRSKLLALRRSRLFGSSPVLDDPLTDSVENDQSPTQIGSPVTRAPSNSKGKSFSNVDPRDYEDCDVMMGGDDMASDDDFEFEHYDSPAIAIADSPPVPLNDSTPGSLTGSPPGPLIESSADSLVESPPGLLIESTPGPLIESPEKSSIDDSHKADVQDVLDSTQKISPGALGQSQDIPVQEKIERTKVIEQDYNKFSDNGIDGSDDDELPQDENSTGLDVVDKQLMAIDFPEKLLRFHLLDNNDDDIYNSIKNLATTISDSPIFADECVGAECLNRGP
ncbi:hypothetical protein BELL_1768g00010 [Botrytis elliptica]|uniref:Uncharacterized protein n=1 Tax=Botrytis elliptica TaxID=278938 RepID=A0A4Z1I2R0_9HELO|nr:hypothetical protein BELL_1768g00010 [Botrytis elliptica]